MFSEKSHQLIRDQGVSLSIGMIDLRQKIGYVFAVLHLFFEQAVTVGQTYAMGVGQLLDL